MIPNYHHVTCMQYYDLRISDGPLLESETAKKRTCDDTVAAAFSAVTLASNRAAFSATSCCSAAALFVSENLSTYKNHH